MAKLRDRQVIKESAGLRQMNERIDANSKEEKELSDQMDNIINIAQKSKITMYLDQYNRFKDLCKQSCTNRKLKMAGMALGPVAATEILDLVMAGADIAQLILRKNRLGDKGVQIISKCLMNSKNGIEIHKSEIRESSKSDDLILDESQKSANIEPDSIQSDIVSLDLGENEITQLGIKYLSRALQHN